MPAKAYAINCTDSDTPPASQVWTLRREDGGVYAVLRSGKKCGELTIHRSGFAEWSFLATDARPSQTTQRRLLADVRS